MSSTTKAVERLRQHYACSHGIRRFQKGVVIAGDLWWLIANLRYWLYGGGLHWETTWAELLVDLGRDKEASMVLSNTYYSGFGRESKIRVTPKLTKWILMLPARRTP